MPESTEARTAETGTGDAPARIIAGVASFVVPGLGQLVQGRVSWALAFFVVAVAVWAWGGPLPFTAVVLWHGLAAYHAARR